MRGSKSAFSALLSLLLLAQAFGQKAGASEKNNKLHLMRQKALSSSNYIVELDSKMYK